MRRNAKLEAGLDELKGLELAALRQQWAELFGVAPVPRISRDVLIRGIAWRLQEYAHGGLSKSVRRRLVQLAADLGQNGVIRTFPTTALKPGTKLVREWKGKIHEVMICEDGYVWSGKRYCSLTQVARLITGTHWSGPRFFGLEAAQKLPADKFSKGFLPKDPGSLAGSAGMPGG
jgi:hypothetical protein